MMADFTGRNTRILALDPYTRGIGFVVIEGQDKLLDWGMKEARADKHARCLRHVEALIKTYQPDVIVVEDVEDPSCRRCQRVRELLRDICALAKARKVTVMMCSWRAVLATFSDDRASTKYELTNVIVKRFPELAPYQPPFRKPWMSEDSRMSIFDAVALACCCFFL
jgi:RNase H-fold protein (predicted Holliday junction resolvase)